MGSTLYSKRFNPRKGRSRRTRPKTFLSEDQAKAFALKNKLADYKVMRKVNSKKFIVSCPSASPK